MSETKAQLTSQSRLFVPSQQFDVEMEPLLTGSTDQHHEGLACHGK